MCKKGHIPWNKGLNEVLSESYKKWLEDGCPKIYCNCPSHEEIKIIETHKYDGIPMYTNGHNSKTHPISESYQRWLDNKCPKVYCHCPCHQEISIKEYHKYDGIPKFILGHNQGIIIISESYQKWLNDNQPKIYCKCGCNQEIIVKDHHKQRGIPEYISGHNLTKENNPMLGKIGDKSPAWKGGISKLPYYEKWTEELREEIRNQYNRKCYLCGKTEEDQINEMKEKGKQSHRLSVHHIDEDKEQGCNGKKWKLIPLCIHCHGKIHNHKIKLEEIK